MKKYIQLFLAGIMACVVTIPVNAAEINTGMYETLRTPNYEELQLEIEDTSISYTMDVCDDRIYIIGQGLTIEHEKKESPVVLIYDETKNTWSSIWATFLESDGELDIIAGDDVLYFFDNHYSSLMIYGYNLETKEVKQLSSFSWDTQKRGPELSYDGEYIWMYGGEYRDDETGAWTMLSGVSRWEIASGKLEEVDVSEEEKECLFEEITNQKEEEKQMLAEAKKALGIQGEAEITGTLTEESFYVFGDVEEDGQIKQIFCRFSLKDTGEASGMEEEVEINIAESVTEEASDSREEGTMILIVAVCVFVAVGSVAGIVRRKLVKKDVKTEGDEK